MDEIAPGADLQAALPASRVVRIRNFLSYGLAFLALGAITASLGPALPSLAVNTASSLAQISALFAYHRLGYMLGALAGGRLFDRHAGNLIMGAMLMISAAALSVLPLLSVRGVLFLVLFVVGLGESVIDVGGNVMLVWWFRKQAGPYINGLHFFFGLGAFLAPLLITWSLLVRSSLDWGYWLLCLVVLPNAFWLLRLPSPPRPGALRADEAASAAHKLLPLLFMLFFFLFVAAETSYGDWLYTYTLTQKLASEKTAGLLTSAYWGALTLGRLLSVPLAARLPAKTLLWADLAGCVLSLAVLLTWPRSLPAAWAGSVGFGLFLASLFPTSITLAGESMRLSGRTTGLFLVGGSAGAMALPWLIGQLFAPAGPGVMIIAVLAVILTAFAVLAAITRLSGAAGKAG
jgi:FHS family Na+ dependent glucose MFS transporter 1